MSFEKVNPSHPDKVADRIAGALVDFAYSVEENPKIAVEVLIGHGLCTIISEASINIPDEVAKDIVKRIAGRKIELRLLNNLQDTHLAQNQQGAIRCGDNGIFRGAPITTQQKVLTQTARDIYAAYPSDGKYILTDKGVLVICQSNADERKLANQYGGAIINPLGHWTGGTDVDTGATNRKLGSDMGDGVTGGGLHGKDLSKADVSVNIYAHLLAQREGYSIDLYCAIGDELVNGVPYATIVQQAREYIREIGGFEKFAEWGLIRP